MGWLGDSWDFVFALQSGSWAAIAAWVAVVVGATTVVVTGKYAKAQIEQAKSQLRTAEQTRVEQASASEAARQAAENARAQQAQEAETAERQQAADAQKLREEQARPYVVALLEPDRAHWGFADLVIKNYGKTAAYDVVIAFSPALQVAPYERTDTGETVTHLAHPERIPMLAPGQEWRTAWDYAVSRNEAGPELVQRYESSIGYQDTVGKTHTSPGVLDWEVFNDTMNINTHTVHDLTKVVTKELEKQNMQLSKIRAALEGYAREHSGVWVYSSDPVQEREFREQEAKDRRERMQRLHDQIRPPQPQGEGEGRE